MAPKLIFPSDIESSSLWVEVPSHGAGVLMRWALCPPYCANPTISTSEPFSWALWAQGWPVQPVAMGWARKASTPSLQAPGLKEGAKLLPVDERGGVVALFAIFSTSGRGGPFMG